MPLAALLSRCGRPKRAKADFRDVPEANVFG